MLTYQTQFPANPQPGQPLFVMLHGRGVDENDMLPLADFFPHCLLVAVRAPFPAAQWGYGGGYAWYRHLGGVRPSPEHFEHSQNALVELLAHLPDVLPVKHGPFILGGFSQGGTMSMGYALRNPGSADLFLNLSGFLPEHPSIEVTPATVAPNRFYWPHGLYDMAVPHANAQLGREQLLAVDACLAAPDFPIAHTIVREELDDILELIANL